MYFSLKFPTYSSVTSSNTNCRCPEFPVAISNFLADHLVVHTEKFAAVQHCWNLEIEQKNIFFFCGSEGLRSVLGCRMGE